MKSSERKPFFRFIKSILRLFIKPPKIHNRNDSLAEGAIFICNHVGSTVPLKLELYLRQPFKFWGTYEMTISSNARYDYLANNYFHKKKHNPKAVAHLKAFFANPFVGMFYKGMQLIPTYQDGRLLKTIKYSMNYLNANKSLVIFPENSSDGYHEVLTEYHAGFLFLAKHFYQKTKRNIPIYNMYYRKKDNTLVIDKVYTIEDLLSDSRDIREIAADFKNRANELSTIPLD